jgi:hypothetical protein
LKRGKKSSCTKILPDFKIIQAISRLPIKFLTYQKSFMKKSFFPVLYLFIIAISGCKKDSGTNNTNQDDISAKDPVALSKNLKIWHAVHVAGSTPAPTGGNDAPSVSGPDGGKILAFAGKYAVLKPIVNSGSVAGYYLGIAGAGEYFKLDYSKSRAAERPVINKKKKLFGRPLGGEDSSIVIVLPPNIQTPDSFCITYCPYDSLGNIGQPVTTCIVLNTLGGDASSSWLSGNWRLYAQTKDNAINPSDIYIYNYNTWNISSYLTKYYCITDNSGSNYVSSYCFDSASCSALSVSDSAKYIKNDFGINSNGGWVFSQSFLTKDLDVNNSTCSDYVFSNDSDSDEVTGGWSVSGDKFTMIYDFSGDGVDEYDAFQYTIQKVNDNEFKLIDNVSVDADNYQIVFRKL